MSILSKITGALSVATGLSLRTKIEVVMGAIIIAGIAAGWLWLHSLINEKVDQAHQINNLTTSNATLTQQKSQLQTDKASAEAQRDVYAVRVEVLNQENKANEKKAQQYQKDSENALNKLAQLQKADACASHAVPDGVIRMQQQAVDNFNAGYSG